MKITKGTANVYADIGVKGAKAMLAKAQLAFKIDEFIRSRKLSKIKAARIMELSQSQLTDILKGRFRETSIAQIKAYLKRLEIDEDPLAEDLSGYIGKLKWRKTHFKFKSPNALTQKALADADAGKGLVRAKDATDLFDKLGPKGRPGKSLVSLASEWSSNYNKKPPKGWLWRASVVNTHW